MKKKLITLGLGLAIVATSVAAVSANEEVKVPVVESEITAQNNAGFSEFGGFYGGTSYEEMLERRSAATGVSIEDLQEQYQGRGQGTRGGMIGTPNECDPEILAQRAAEAGLTVEEFQAQQLIDREAFRADRRQQMAELKGISVDELGQGQGSQGKRRGMANRYQ